jgi:hypothetical protein
MIPTASVRKRVGGVKHVALALLLTMSAAHADMWLVPDGRALPDLCAQRWQPDLFAGAGLRTMDAAALYLRRALLAAPAPPPWLRLDGFDLCPVGDCETCAAPADDPHRLIDESAPVSLDGSRARFIGLAAETLRGVAASPYVVVAPGEPPPDGFRAPDGLLVLLATPPLPEAARPATLAARRAQAAAWRAVAPRVYSVVSDGLEALAGYPRSADLAAEQADALGDAAVMGYDAAAYARRGPPALAARQRAVVLDGVTSPEGDRWRADQPLAARILDLFASPDAAGGALAEASVTALREAARWQEDPGRASNCLSALDAYARAAQAAGVKAPGDGPLSPALRSWVASDEAVPVVDIPVVEGLKLSERLRHGAWTRAARLDLTRDDRGAPCARPSTVWLARDAGGDLWAAAEATEPRPEEATYNDRLVLKLAVAGEDGPVLELSADVHGRVGLARLSRPGGSLLAVESAGVEAEGLFAGPGWVVKVHVAAALLGESARRWRLQAATEHRAGRRHWETLWRPTCGCPWNARAAGVARFAP